MIKNTYTLIQTVKKMYPVVQFFKDRYFPDYKVYWSEKALLEFKKKNRKIAPFVIPYVNGIVMENEGYRADEVVAPYIVPKKRITAADLAKKAFGESPESERRPDERENELEAEYVDDLRNAIFRRHELMCAELILTGQILMKSYATANDAAKDENYELNYLRFYDKEFKNEYKFTKDFASMTAKEKLQELYNMSSVLRKRGIRATDLVMTSDVSMLLMTDQEFLKYYDLAKVDYGDIKPEELPEGVVCNGRVNINGVIMTLFTYDEVYEDFDGNEKAMLPAGTIAMLQPGMGSTVYAQVTFYSKDKGFVSYAEKVVPRLTGSEEDNVAEVQAFSRPVMYPLDWDSWLVSNIYSDTVTQEVANNSVDLDEEPKEGAVLKTQDEISAMNKKATLIEYAESIGLSSMTTDMSLEELKNSILTYQEDTYGEDSLS